jgi:hypothetical protein
VEHEDKLALDPIGFALVFGRFVAISGGELNSSGRESDRADCSVLFRRLAGEMMSYVSSFEIFTIFYGPMNFGSNA